MIATAAAAKSKGNDRSFPGFWTVSEKTEDLMKPV